MADKIYIWILLKIELSPVNIFFRMAQGISLLLMFHLAHDTPAEKWISDNYPRLKFPPIFIFNDGFEILKARKWADQMTDS